MPNPDKTWPTPAPDTFHLPRAVDLNYNEAKRIKAATGIRVHQPDDLGELAYGIGWLIATTEHPEYRGVPFDVVASWPLNVFTFRRADDDDTDDVAQANADAAEGEDDDDNPPTQARSGHVSG